MDVATMTERLLALGKPKTVRDPGRYLQSGHDDLALVSPYLRDADVVFDFGCGYGRLGAAVVGTPYRYVGVDAALSRADYAADFLGGYDNCVIRHFDAYNGRYNREGQPSVTLRLPAGDGTCGAAFAISVFTHVASGADVSHYLRELRRILRPGAPLVSTWLTDPPMDRAKSTDRRAVRPAHVVPLMLAGAGFDVRTVTGTGSESDHVRYLAVARL